MATIFSDLVPIRRVAVGTSATAQGLDGVPELTITAKKALLASSWEVSTDAPAMPVHDYDRGVPAGDAWKACYGYDAAARTERGACGAVVYSFALPSSSVAVASISASIIGDRYLDAGVNVYAILSSSAAPPTPAEIYARTPDASGLCATGDQTATPNNREAVTATFTATPGTAAAYLHLALMLTDYEGARGAWIEGGAMLSAGAATITFASEVSTAYVSGELLAVTAKNGNTVSVGSVLLAADYSGFSGQTATADTARHVLDLFFSGALLHDFTAETQYAATSISGGMDKNNSSAPGAYVFACGAAFYAPPSSVRGASVTFPTVTISGGGTIRCAVLQSSLAPSMTAVETFAVSKDIDPCFYDIISGGSDMLGFADITATGAPIVKINSTPQKPFLYLCLVPLSRSSVSTDFSGVATIPWRVALS